MAYLIRTSSRFLGQQIDFERESYLEGFLFGNPLILASSQDTPEGLIPVYIIGRQEMCKKASNVAGITDLICLIWDQNLQKYQIWVYELKVYSANTSDVEQLIDYLEALKSDENRASYDELFERAVALVGDELVDRGSEIRGALCAQAFSDEVMQKIIEENSKRPNDWKILAIKIYRFPVDNDVFVLVEPVVGEEQAKSGGHVTYYDDIPQLTTEEIKAQLADLMEKRRRTHPQRFEQLKVLLEMLANNPTQIVTQEELRNEWLRRDLPKEDQGLSVSQVLGYKKSSPLRQIIKWQWVAGDVKDNYELRNESYAEVVKETLAGLRGP